MRPLTFLPTVSKNRRPKFSLELSIHDLNNVPLVNGTSFVKWHLPSSSSAEHRGRTPKAPVHDHSVTWSYTKNLDIRLPMDKTNMLQELLIQFEVVQDYGSSVRGGEKIVLGTVSLNLSEYVEMAGGGPLSPGPGEGEDEGVVRRYLMQDSKINSTLKVGIAMRQVDGERNFIAPPLKTAPVFGGIAGIMGQEQGDADDLGHMPSINRSREAGELQDVYRKSLAAYWAAQAGELPADQCIEDIFSGGDGWRSKRGKDRNSKGPGSLGVDGGFGRDEYEGEDYERWNGTGTESGKGHKRNSSSNSTGSRHTVTARSVGARLGHKISKSQDEVISHRYGHAHSSSHDHVSHIGQQHHHHHHRHHRDHSDHEHSRKLGSSHGSANGETGFRPAIEVDEFDIREDLMSWRLPGAKTLEEKVAA